MEAVKGESLEKLSDSFFIVLSLSITYLQGCLTGRFLVLCLKTLNLSNYINRKRMVIKYELPRMTLVKYGFSDS